MGPRQQHVRVGLVGGGGRGSFASRVPSHTLTRLGPPLECVLCPCCLLLPATVLEGMLFKMIALLQAAHQHPLIVSGLLRVVALSCR